MGFKTLYRIILRRFPNLSATHRKQVVNELKNNWQNFLSISLISLKNYPHYLTTTDRNQIINQLKMYEKSFYHYNKPWFQRWDIELVKLKENWNFIEGYNSNYLILQPRLFASFFNGQEFKHKQALNQDQVTAILTDDTHNLVIAGPGAGKTRVLTDRVAFQILKQHIPADRILVLAYNNSAVSEVKERLKRIYNLNNLHITTFHALGLNILHNSDQTRFTIVDNSDHIIVTIINELKQSDIQFQEMYIKYQMKWNSDDREVSDPVVLEQEYLLQLNKEYEAIDGTVVKSIAERDIANFFIIHNIEYQYEPKVTWCDMDQSYTVNSSNRQIREYHPDFYLPKYDIYLEHWANSESGLVPPWFADQNLISTIENYNSLSEQEIQQHLRIKATEKYNSMKNWKRAQFSHCQKTLWETDYEIWRTNNLEQELKKKFMSLGMQLSPLTQSEIITKYFSKNDSLENNFSNAIHALKIYGYDTHSFKLRLEDLIHQKFNRQTIRVNEYRFYELVCVLLERYENWLKAHNAIDFEDMINHSIKQLIRNNAQISTHSQNELQGDRNPNTQYTEPKISPGLKGYDQYQMILVDEFQDISFQRIRLLQELLKFNPRAHLFCVVDDWQAIYGFAGSSSCYMVHFADYFPNPQTTILQMNYRNPPQILTLGAQILAECSEKTQKTLIPQCPISFEPLVINSISTNSYRNFLDLQAQQAKALICNLIQQKIPPEEIMVLSRFNYGYAELKELCLQDPALPVEVHKNDHKVRTGIRFLSFHKSKGLEAQFIILLNFHDGLYGFPPDRDAPFNMQIINPELASWDDEERRLLYVALTRVKHTAYIWCWTEKPSKFISPIRNCLTRNFQKTIEDKRTSTSTFSSTSTSISTSSTISSKSNFIRGRILNSTEKAILFSGSFGTFPKTTLWIPRSVILEIRPLEHSQLKEFSLKPWFLKQRF